jgi:hypothetical protein
MGTVRKAAARAAITTVCIAALCGGFVAQIQAHASASIDYNIVALPVYGGEPSIASDPNGVLYDTTPSAGGPVFRSTDRGQTWQGLSHPWTGSGDDCVATDESTAVYWCNLGSQAESWKSIDAPTCTAACTWTEGVGTGPACTVSGNTSCQPFMVDRQWEAASLGNATSTDHATVVLMYHDFFGNSQIWVNVSHDGGATFNGPTSVLVSPTFTPNSVTGDLEGLGYQICNTVPSGVSITPQLLHDGSPNPHAGRIIVAWIAADAAQDAAGCNYTMFQSFHTLWISYSDDGGATWTGQLAFDAGVGHDASTPFTTYNTDRDGNPYMAFSANRWNSNPALNAAAVQQCAVDSAAGTEQTDLGCGYDTYVVWSNDGGTTWDGGGGTVPGSAAAPYKVNNDNGTDQFPTIAIGDPGKVDISFLHTPTVEPTDNLGKFLPGGCAGPTSATPNYPPACHWNLEVAQSLNLTAPPMGTGAATWQNLTKTTYDVHIGDICNLGIACVSTVGSNRHLLDFNSETVDPTTGCAHVAYADDHTVNKLEVANQIDGPSVIGNGTCASLVAVTPEAPLALLLPIAGAAIALGVRRSRARVTT